MRARKADAHQGAKIERLRKTHSISDERNIAYTEGAIDGNPYKVTAHSGYKRSAESTIEPTPLEKQPLKTRPTKADYEEAARRGIPVDPTRRAYDSEVKTLEDLLRKTTPGSTGDLLLVSERAVCTSCEAALQQFQQLRPGIRIRVWHAVK